jgi:hypothetical protein
MSLTTCHRSRSLVIAVVVIVVVVVVVVVYTNLFYGHFFLSLRLRFLLAALSMILFHT